LDTYKEIFNAEPPKEIWGSIDEPMDESDDLICVNLYRFTVVYSLKLKGSSDGTEDNSLFLKMVNDFTNGKIVTVKQIIEEEVDAKAESMLSVVGIPHSEDDIKKENEDNPHDIFDKKPKLVVDDQASLDVLVKGGVFLLNNPMNEYGIYNYD